MPIILAFLTFAVFIGISLISERMQKRMAARPAPNGPTLGDEMAPHAAASAQPPLVLLPSTRGGVARIEGYAYPASECEGAAQIGARRPTSPRSETGLLELGAEIRGNEPVLRDG